MEAEADFGAEADIDLDPEEPMRMQDHYVVVNDVVNYYFQSGKLPLAAGSGVCEVIIITEAEGKLLVALPAEVWSRRVNTRLLDQRGLARPVLCSVVGCHPESRDMQDESVNLRVWIGFLSDALAAAIDFDVPDRMALDYPILSSPLPEFIPYSQSLVEVMQERFSFFSAESGGGAPTDPKGPAAPSAEARLGAVESTLADIQKSLAVLLESPKAASLPGPSQARPSALRPAGAAPKRPADRVKILEPSTKLSGLDGSVVQAALAAGVPEEHLREMSEFLRRNPNRMGDIPANRGKAKELDDLSDSEDEEAEVEESLNAQMQPGSPGDGGVAKAIVKLTKVCSALAESRSSKKSLEGLLDSGSASSDGSGLGSSRRNAAALRLLKDSLVKDPELIYKSIESNMASDFLSRPAAPGTPLAGATARGWLESRSRLMNYTSHVRWTWAVAGIWDSLMRGEVAQARARAALLVAAADQASIDQGSWLLSNVMMLEPAAPSSSFAGHHPPGPQDLQHTALIDSRWIELFLGHVKEMDSYQEAKKRLSRDTKREQPDPRPAAKEKAKAKAKGGAKGGKGGGKKEDAAEADAGN